MSVKLGRYQIPLLVLSLLLPQLVGAAGALFTFPSIASWYPLITKPNFTPPDWVFGPVWSALYVLMGISLFLIVQKRMSHETLRAVELFFVQLFLNLLWSIVFFGTNSIGGGLVVIIVLWGSVFFTILKFSKFSQTAAILLLPYLAWITFATYLNFAFFWLNS